MRYAASEEIQQGWRCNGHRSIVAQLLAQAISVPADVSSCQLDGVGHGQGHGLGATLGKCNVCQAVNEQFHGNIVTLLLTAIGAEFLSSSSSPATATAPAGVTIHLLVVPMLA